MLDGYVYQPQDGASLQVGSVRLPAWLDWAKCKVVQRSRPSRLIDRCSCLFFHSNLGLDVCITLRIDRIIAGFRSLVDQVQEATS